MRSLLTITLLAAALLPLSSQVKTVNICERTRKCATQSCLRLMRMIAPQRAPRGCKHYFLAQHPTRRRQP